MTPIRPDARDSAGPYRFGGCMVDPLRRIVTVDGRPVDAQPKVFDLLMYLLERRDRVVDKRELLDALWPETVVTEASLTQAVRKLRKLLGDVADQPVVIRTVSRRGFQFIAPVNGPQAPAAPSPPQQQPVGIPSIAVLPFADMSPARDQAYFCEGIAAEILSALHRVEGMRVASRTSAFAASHAGLDIREVGARLGVGHVLEGSVRRSDERLRVTAELVNASSGFQVWSERWDRHASDVFDIQDDIAMRIVAALKRHLSARDREAVLSTPTSSLTAYDHYLNGLRFLNRFGRRSQRAAIEFFRQALTMDAAYVPAWAGLATSHALLYLYAEATEENASQARTAAERAVSLDPTSAEAHTARGMAAALTGDFAAAEAAFDRA
ncbi:MAG TPA: winged helix-turn-helix domain-containing protein, partial [Steroidobacteraceae bacterium]|nr:winged helix-turn-helix domain-containing protein [Steroidobacteraceae bacterium]